MIGEGEYNLNVLKEIKVTDSFLGFDKDVRGCQNKEPFSNCTTRIYRNTILKECGCLPFNIRLFDKVCFYKGRKNVVDFYLTIFFHVLGSSLLLFTGAGLCRPSRS